MEEPCSESAPTTARNGAYEAEVYREFPADIGHYVLCVCGLDREQKYNTPMQDIGLALYEYASCTESDTTNVYRLVKGDMLLDIDVEIKLRINVCIRGELPKYTFNSAKVRIVDGVAIYKPMLTIARCNSRKKPLACDIYLGVVGYGTWAIYSMIYWGISPFIPRKMVSTASTELPYCWAWDNPYNYPVVSSRTYVVDLPGARPAMSKYMHRLLANSGIRAFTPADIVELSLETLNKRIPEHTFKKLCASIDVVKYAQLLDNCRRVIEEEGDRGSADIIWHILAPAAVGPIPELLIRPMTPMSLALPLPDMFSELYGDDYRL